MKAVHTRKLDRFVEILRQRLPEFRERYKVRSLGVFGSYVRNAQKPGSDLDVLVQFTEAPDLFTFMELEEHLARLLGVKVELVSRRALKGNIGNRILREAVMI